MRSVALADAAGVFGERYVADVMRAVFDAPVTPSPFEELGCIRLIARHAGNGVIDFRRLGSTLPSRANYAAHLCQMRPIAVIGQTSARL